jgi:hypothetical protein
VLVIVAGRVIVEGVDDDALLDVMAEGRETVLCEGALLLLLFCEGRKLLFPLLLLMDPPLLLLS